MTTIWLLSEDFEVKSLRKICDDRRQKRAVKCWLHCRASKENVGSLRPRGCNRGTWVWGAIKLSLTREGRTWGSRSSWLVPSSWLEIAPSTPDAVQDRSLCHGGFGRVRGVGRKGASKETKNTVHKKVTIWKPAMSDAPTGKRNETATPLSKWIFIYFLLIYCPELEVLIGERGKCEKERSRWISLSESMVRLKLEREEIWVSIIYWTREGEGERVIRIWIRQDRKIELFHVCMAASSLCCINEKKKWSSKINASNFSHYSCFVIVYKFHQHFPGFITSAGK